ncbi:General odorant-binding protein 69a [Orchesella cincta]|uniref:General odorant-binding protein 69a n=1 Tax=Orchesella cincta TaxID=48709 RepID=A0A1D2MMP7_ORCCI|nr:General odorant-binding protein 69a [Orchesella cincta]
MDLDSILQFRQNLTMMKLDRISGYILLVLALYAMPGNNMQITSCRGVDLDITEDHIMHMNVCLKEAGAKEVKDVDPSKMPCFGKCVMARQGLIDDKGLPHKENLKKMIKDHLPKDVHDDLNKRIEFCLLPNNTEIIDPKDESCATYLPTLMCMHIAFLEECSQGED